MGDSVSQPSTDDVRWTRLTEKQRACLDLLLDRQTSKQIARRLDISKPTVDQRLTAARQILGAANRDEAAILYGQLKQTYDRITYDPVQVPSDPGDKPSIISDAKPAEAMVLQDSGAASVGSPSRNFWRHDHDLKARIWIMTAMLVVAVILILAGLGIAQALTRLVSG
ncbi:bacterial regulatory s, luxR family protein (plasmid) [Blastomonas sp. RAC04]|uniref:helix-turn-helix domain-containing protein n=1 Tax=Blastomonas sp. RAC04 TaxID=1842535 RepID=UPI00083D71DA|nr:helix-turn-helix transcriptional regulator [Blastomonas sp. RAC04]AOF98796.1 bacterial regulatory s, luxR family protein [Blastomonas sp. RAC04]